MIVVRIARNQFEQAKADRFDLDRIDGSVVSDYLPDELDASKVEFFLDGNKVEGSHLVGDACDLLIVVRPGFAAVGAAIVQGLAAVAISYTFSLLFGRPAKPKQNEEESSTYSWSGSRQNNSAGSPIAITAGKMRIGGTVIGEYVNAQATPAKNVLFQLVALGEGPLSAISSATTDTTNGNPIDTRAEFLFGRKVFIDDQRAENISGVQAHVRMGTPEQSVIEWFDKVRLEHEIGRTLDSVEDSSSNNQTLSFDPVHWFDGGNASLWTDYGVGYTLEDEADSVKVRVRYPRGLYTTDSSSGEIRSSWTGIQVRYRELDAIGNQIGSGGMNGDGWVYTPPVLPFSVEHREAFEYDHELVMFDKDTYAPPGLGSACNTGPNSNANGNIQIPGTGSPVIVGAVAPAFCCAFWVKINSISGSLGDIRHIAGDLDEANQEGWSLCIQRVATSFGVQYWTLIGRSGTGSSVVNTTNYSPSFPNPKAPVAVGEWVHLSMSYTPGTKFEAWINGNMAFQAVSVPAIKWGGNIHFGRNPQGAGTTLTTVDSIFDDFLLWEDAISEDMINEQFALGVGRYGTGYVDNLRCWINWESPGLTQKAASPWYADGTLSNGAFIGVATGKVTEDPNLSGTPKRGRYHVEVARINVKSTSPETSDLAELASITTVLNESLAYPGVPLLALRVEASDQLSNSMPPTSVICQGSKWPVWDGLSTSSPSISKLYTANPAWICYGILTDKKIGLGRYYSLSDVDLLSLKAWADYCDEVLSDGSYPLAFSPASIFNDIRYNALTLDPVSGIVRGSFEVVLPKSIHGDLPLNWQPDKWIKLEGLPTPITNPGQVTNDPNGAYRIRRIDDGGTFWTVWLWWDRTMENNPWTSGLFLGFNVLGGPLGSVFPGSQIQGGAPRFEFNGTFDTHGNAWESMVKVAEVGRAVPIPSGNKVFFQFSAPRQASALITRGSIIPGTFELTIGGASDDTNAYDYTYQSQIRAFERQSDEIFDESISDPSDLSTVIRRSTDLFGVTHPEQARRTMLFDLRARRLLKRRGRLEMPVDGLQLQPGDVVRLAHDVLPRGVSGRLMDGSTTTSVKLDQRITFLAGKTYQIVIRRSGSGFLVGIVNVAGLGGPGTYEHGTAIPITGVSEPFGSSAPYIVTETGRELVVEVGSTSLTQDMRRVIEFVEYSEAVFTDL